MAEKRPPSNEDPAEGSRKVVEHELKREKGKAKKPQVEEERRRSEG